VTYALTSAGLWVNRANQAWGSSRQYNVGSSFETDSANWQSSSSTWQGRANNAWGASRVWNSGQSFEVDRNAAYDSGSWGSGNLWSADCHNDPNVWTNRYNTGYSDGQTAYSPPSSPLTWTGTFNSNTITYQARTQNPVISGSGSLGLGGSGSTTLSMPKTGRYIIFAQCGTQAEQWATNCQWRLDLFTSAGNVNGYGTYQKNSNSGGGNSNPGQAVATVNWVGTLSAGNTFYFQLNNLGGGYNDGYPTGDQGFIANQVYVEFIPTPSYPH